MIIYFSGTGNSRYIAEGLAALTGDSLADATALIRKKEYPKLYSDRPWVFVCPVYGWRIPHIFRTWIEKSGFSGSRSAYFIINCGGEIGNAARYVKPLCRSKKLELLGVREIVMPENYIAMFDAPDAETAAKIRRIADRVIKKTAEAINCFERFPKKKLSFSDRFKSAVVNPFFYAFCVKSKKFRTTDMCVSCGKCAAECPMNGIEMREGHPHWTGACTHCMACICGCPVSAIEYGKKSLDKVRYQCPHYGESAVDTGNTSDGSSAEANSETTGETRTMLKHNISFTLSADDFDTHGNIIPSRLLSMFQKLANEHAVILGVGFDEMLSRNLLWVITQIKYQICGRLEAGMQLAGETWPLPPSRMNYERQYLLSDAQGNPLIKGTSIWMLIDAEQRTLAKAADVYPEGEYCTVNNFTEKLRRIRDFETDGSVFDVCPDQSTIDENGHVNNTKYADFVLAALGDLGGEVDTFQIDYINEIMCGETVHIQKAEKDGNILVKGLSDEDKRMFACSILLK